MSIKVRGSNHYEVDYDATDSTETSGITISVAATNMRDALKAADIVAKRDWAECIIDLTGVRILRDKIWFAE